LDNPGDFENFNFFKELKLDQYSDIIEYQPHNLVISEMHQATILLLLIGDYPHGESVMTGKIFEYLRAGRPILAVVPPNGIAAEVIRETNSGFVASTKSEQDIAECISKLFDLFLKGDLEKTFSNKGIEKFSRENLTMELVSVFESSLE
jgi:glycosyltransferase involved in cell wall biosynthesis